MSIKTFKNRDSATSFLRKREIAKEAYNDYIKKTEDGTFEIDVDLIPPFAVEQPVVSDDPLQIKFPKKKEEKPVVHREKKSTEAKAEGQKKVTITSLAQDLIRWGKTNDEVFAELQKTFGLDDNKKHYPSWYRSKMRKAGENV